MQILRVSDLRKTTFRSLSAGVWRLPKAHSIIPLIASGLGVKEEKEVEGVETQVGDGSNLVL
jgi:TPP-dependent trihydroxycyclohexane-1,2-dione (THcHDO) dehydratase